MKATEYCDVLNLEMRLTYYPNQGGRWTAFFENCELKETPDSGVLCGAYGNGASPALAIADYVNRIRGKTLVVDAMSPQRRVYMVPESLEA